MDVQLTEASPRQVPGRAHSVRRSAARECSRNREHAANREHAKCCIDSWLSRLSLFWFHRGVSAASGSHRHTKGSQHPRRRGFSVQFARCARILLHNPIIGTRVLERGPGCKNGSSWPEPEEPGGDSRFRGVPPRPYTEIFSLFFSPRALPQKPLGTHSLSTIYIYYYYYY
jgi:hypothetical protein